MIVMGMPLGFVYLATAIWLMAKGFQPQKNPQITQITQNAI
jgi:hypothetical protein